MTPIELPRQPMRAYHPIGVITPDLSAKRSVVLTNWTAERQAARAAAAQVDRVRQQQQASRAYAGAAFNRLTGDWTALNTSADSELLTSLRPLRARSRELVRDNAYALHCVRLIQNNVIGNGIGLQCQVKTAGGKLLTKVNSAMEEAFADWAEADSCHTAGLLSLADVERVCAAELVVAGEAIVRLVRQPFGRRNQIPLGLEVIEADCLLDNWQTAHAPNGNLIRMGVEINQWHRPVAYWFNPNHPGDYQFSTFQPSKYLRVPAEDIIHLYVINRWPQTRGEPWFHSTLRINHDEEGFSEAEIVKARAQANLVGFITSSEGLVAEEVQANRQIINTEPGTWQKLLPGETVAGFNSTSPNPAVAAFLQHMVRKMSVGMGLSYEALSRDYTGASYSSARMGLLEDRSMYRVLQGFFMRNLRKRLHIEWMDAATLVGAIKPGNDYYSNSRKYQAVAFKPRGWSWIDPTKEVAAYKAAVRSGFMTNADVIAQTNEGADIEDVYKTLHEERELADELDLVLDTNPAQVNDKGAEQGAAAPVQTSAPEGDDTGTSATAADEDTQPGADGASENEQ
ncbi:MAG: portal protein [Burkholderiales phage 68_11]|nr:MAG: portal protein [Burkholderiales phage 68_11]